jgi:surface polysaccharide O-acyltransferase-like enzyme
MLRILGYSVISHTNVLDVATTWISSLSYHILSLSDYAEPALPSLYMLVGRLIANRQIPFLGFLSKNAADSFYVLGFAAWAIAMGLCWKLHRKGVSPVAVALGFVMAAALVPAWFLAFEQHTIAHAWMTGRLVTLFCGLGMSLAVLAGWALATTYSSRGQGEPKASSPRPMTVPSPCLDHRRRQVRVPNVRFDPLDATI